MSKTQKDAFFSPTTFLCSNILDNLTYIQNVKNCLRIRNISLLCSQFHHKKLKKMSEIATKVTSIITDKLGVEESQVVPEASFTNDLGADSLDTVELIMELEKEFDLSIPDEEAEKIVTVGDAIAFIENAKK